MYLKIGQYDAFVNICFCSLSYFVYFKKQCSVLVMDDKDTTVVILKNVPHLRTTCEPKGDVSYA